MQKIKKDSTHKRETLLKVTYQGVIQPPNSAVYQKTTSEGLARQSATREIYDSHLGKYRNNVLGSIPLNSMVYTFPQAAAIETLCTNSEIDPAFAYKVLSERHDAVSKKIDKRQSRRIYPRRQSPSPESEPERRGRSRRVDKVDSSDEVKSGSKSRSRDDRAKSRSPKRSERKTGSNLEPSDSARSPPDSSKRDVSPDVARFHVDRDIVDDSNLKTNSVDVDSMKTDEIVLDSDSPEEVQVKKLKKEKVELARRTDEFVRGFLVSPDKARFMMGLEYQLVNFHVDEHRKHKSGTLVVLDADVFNHNPPTHVKDNFGYVFCSSLAVVKNTTRNPTKAGYEFDVSQDSGILTMKGENVKNFQAAADMNCPLFVWCGYLVHNDVVCPDVDMKLMNIEEPEQPKPKSTSPKSTSPKSTPKLTSPKSTKKIRKKKS